MEQAVHCANLANLRKNEHLIHKPFYFCCSVFKLFDEFSKSSMSHRFASSFWLFPTKVRLKYIR